MALAGARSECRWEGRGDGRLGGRLVLGGGRGLQVGAEGLDLSLDGGGVERGVLGGQAAPAKRLDRGVGQRAGVGRLRSVVLLGDLRTVADLGDQLLLGVERVAEQRLQRPDLVQQGQLAGVS